METSVTCRLHGGLSQPCGELRNPGDLASLTQFKSVIHLWCPFSLTPLSLLPKPLLLRFDGNAIVYVQKGYKRMYIEENKAIVQYLCMQLAVHVCIVLLVVIVLYI